jgi:hypothetical protein
MPEKPKPKSDETVADDQKERGYYYDDSHGYEEFDPEDNEEEEEDTGKGGRGDSEIACQFVNLLASLRPLSPGHVIPASPWHRVSPSRT